MDIYATLNYLMKQSTQQWSNECHKKMENLMASCVSGMEEDSEKLLAVMMLQALQKKVQGVSQDDHIYLKKFEIPQIQLFTILIEKFPFVKYSQLIVNNCILERIGNAPEATLIDIGIGQGVQVAHVIAAAQKLPFLKRLHVIGIEPFKEALTIAEERITSLRDTVPFEIVFTPICNFIEQLQFSTLAKDIKGTLIVNASFALHHIQDASSRLQVIKQIKQIKPQAFLLSEPNINHFEVDFYTRFVNCYRHYYTIFKVIDSIEIAQLDKNALKVFFGREIDDIIGKKETDRYEKHEPATTWISRLIASEFQLRQTLLQSPVDTVLGVVIGHHPEGFLGFTYEEETILAVFCAE